MPLILRKGAFTPLLFILSQPILACLSGLVLLLLVGCSRSSVEPKLFASGYIADNGVVRIWRKEDNKHRPLGIKSIFTPNSDYSIVTRYEFLAGSLSQIDNQIQLNDKIQLDHKTQQQHKVQQQLPVSERLRLDEEGNVTFMQRQLPDRREMLDANEISYLRYISQQIIEKSAALREGGVRLLQGWLENGQIFTCSGSSANPDFDQHQGIWLAKQAQENSKFGVAWLESADGTQLLLLVTDDLCAEEPKISDL